MRKALLKFVVALGRVGFYFVKEKVLRIKPK